MVSVDVDKKVKKGGAVNAVVCPLALDSITDTKLGLARVDSGVSVIVLVAVKETVGEVTGLSGAFVPVVASFEDFAEEWLEVAFTLAALEESVATLDVKELAVCAEESATRGADSECETEVITD